MRFVSWMRAKRAGDHGNAAEVARLHRGVLARAALAVVLVADRDPAHPASLEVAGDLRELHHLAGDRVLPLPGLAGERVDRAENMLLEMLSRWPRYLSQMPAGEMWSVVHLPLALRTTAKSV